MVRIATLLILALIAVAWIGPVIDRHPKAQPECADFISETDWVTVKTILGFDLRWPNQTVTCGHYKH